MSHVSAFYYTVLTGEFNPRGSRECSGWLEREGVAVSRPTTIDQTEGMLVVQHRHYANQHMSLQLINLSM